MGGEVADELVVKAVVLNGRVVLDAPLGLPDGTLVTVRRYESGEDVGAPAVRDTIRKLAELADIHDVKLRALERAVKERAAA